jgi:predicted Zn-dependent protease
MNNLGVLLQSTRDYDRAEQLLRRAVALSPRNANVWSNLGNVLRDRGQRNDAIAAYQHALTIDPQHSGARISLAQQYMAISAFPEARSILESLVAENPANAEAQYTIGQVLEQQGDRAGAVRAYVAFTRVASAQFAADVERVRRRIEALSR